MLLIQNLDSENNIYPRSVTFPVAFHRATTVRKTFWIGTSFFQPNSLTHYSVYSPCSRVTHLILVLVN